MSFLQDRSIPLREREVEARRRLAAAGAALREDHSRHDGEFHQAWYLGERRLGPANWPTWAADELESESLDDRDQT